MDLRKLHSKLIAEMGELLFSLLGKDCKLCLVGGVTRDFFLTGELVQDVDFEVRSSRSIEDIITEFPDKLTYEKVAYGIVKVRWNNYDVELAPPRLENFIEGDFSHKNFTATIRQDLTYEQSFARRDFTINAIGLEFHKDELKLVDPYHGQKDLQRKVLVPVSENFYRDPVRFLRLIRFSLKLGFNIGPEAEKILPKFNLQNLTSFYFKTEWKKARNANEFLRLFQDLAKKYSIKVPEWSEAFKPLTSNQYLATPNDYLVQLFFQGEDLKIENTQDFFEWGKGDLASLKNFIVGLKKIDWKIIESLKQQNFDVVKNDPNFLQLHELLSIDRHGRFSEEQLLQSLPSGIKDPYLKIIKRVVPSFSSDLVLKNEDKAFYRSFQRIAE